MITIGVALIFAAYGLKGFIQWRHGEILDRFTKLTEIVALIASVVIIGDTSFHYIPPTQYAPLLYPSLLIIVMGYILLVFWRAYYKSPYSHRLYLGRWRFTMKLLVIISLLGLTNLILSLLVVNYPLLVSLTSNIGIGLYASAQGPFLYILMKIGRIASEMEDRKPIR